MLKLKDVSKYYYQDGVIAPGITKINLELHLGEFVVITGESGSGKSTLLNVLSGLDTYEDGEMYINGEETSHYSEEDFLEYRRKYVSNIFQNFNLVNSYTVYENIELTMLLNGKNKNEIKAITENLIDKVGLKKYRNTHVSKLSGGQKQRVAIARALANDTPIIVADEPTGALDSKASKEILKLLYEISHDKLVIVVTHNKREIASYATRFIRMHDGKILENTLLKKINLDHDLKSKKVSNITFLNKIRLGMRNAFNLPIKFLLMFIIFSLITITLISCYGSLKISEYEELTNGYNEYFNNSKDNRIVINKKDKTYFTEDDYQKINQLSNVDYIVKNDLITDYELFINNSNFYLDGKINTQKINSVDVGNIPNSGSEIVIKGSRDNWYLNSMQDEILNSTFKSDEFAMEFKIVGIIYDDSFNEYTLEFYVSDEVLNNLLTNINKSYLNLTFKLNETYFNNYTDGIYLNILSSDVIPRGEVYIKDDLNYYCSNNNCLNKILNLNVKNIYLNNDYEFKITKILNSNNAKKIIGINYSDILDNVYINNQDYIDIINSNIYQSSVFVKEIKDLDTTVKELNQLGFNTMEMHKAKLDEIEMLRQVFKIMKLIVLSILIITLFFITYFIIKIIYKSRNSYYTTIRTLGGTKKVCISILMAELITLATFTYIVFLIFIYLINKNVINYIYLQNITKYVGILEYIVVFFILILLSIIMSLRYGRKIFKNSIIKTYGERI